MVSRRQERIAELLREELGLLISSELTDPRLEDAMVTVTDVQVSADLQRRMCMWNTRWASSNRDTCWLRLPNAQSFLRRALVENLDLRFVPELFFHIDYDRASRSTHRCSCWKPSRARPRRLLTRNMMLTPANPADRNRTAAVNPTAMVNRPR